MMPTCLQFADSQAALLLAWQGWTRDDYTRAMDDERCSDHDWARWNDSPWLLWHGLTDRQQRRLFNAVIAYWDKIVHREEQPSG